MSKSEKLIPPVEAPLPYRVSVGMEPRIYDANDRCIAWGPSITDLFALLYLVDAANAAPGVEAKLDAYIACMTADLVDVRAARDAAEEARDVALARVAVLEAERDALAREVRVARMNHAGEVGGLRAMRRACEALRVHSPLVADVIQDLANKETL